MGRTEEWGNLADYGIGCQVSAAVGCSEAQAAFDGGNGGLRAVGRDGDDALADRQG